jgi:RNA polymerase sigma factor (TIGR02999 family)
VSSTSTKSVTRLLRAVGQDDSKATEDLLPLVYEQLRALARRQMNQERDGHTLQATALVHEVYLRLVNGGGGAKWASRGQFFCAAAEAMRRILIEHARARKRLKRGGGGPEPRRRVPLGLVELATEHDPSEMLALDEAICRLEEESPDVAAVVRLRFFAGLTVEETAEALGISPQSVKRDWSYARAWLFRGLGY